MSVVSPAVVLGGHREPGDANWRSLDDMLSEPNHEWWKGLEAALSLGGAFTTTRGAVTGRREFCAPYVYATFPAQVPSEVSGERSPWAIIDRDVEVHAEPDAKSRVLGRLSYALVQANGAERHDPGNYDVLWQTIDLADDKEAFVRAEKIRSPDDYHACLANEGGQWLISSFTKRGSP